MQMEFDFGQPDQSGTAAKNPFEICLSTRMLSRVDPREIYLTSNTGSEEVFDNPNFDIDEDQFVYWEDAEFDHMSLGDLSEDLDNPQG